MDNRGRQATKNPHPHRRNAGSLHTQGQPGTNSWCRRRDSNSHSFRHYPLKIACLPISPRRLLRKAVLSWKVEHSTTQLPLRVNSSRHVAHPAAAGHALPARATSPYKRDGRWHQSVMSPGNTGILMRTPGVVPGEFPPDIHMKGNSLARMPGRLTMPAIHNRASGP